MKIKRTNLMLVYCWILCLESITLIIKNNVLSNAIQIVLLLVMLYVCIVKRKKINFGICGIWKIYCMAVTLIIIPDLLSNNVKGGIRYILPFVFRLIIMLLIISYFRGEKITEKGLIVMPVLAGVLFSLGGIIIKIGRNWWFPGYSIADDRINITKMGYLFHVPLGAFIDVWEGNQVERMCSFFTEPTNYALFLEIPLFFSYAYFLEHRKCRSLIWVIIISIGFVMAESRAGFVSVLAAIVIAMIFGVRKGNYTEECECTDIKRDFCKMLVAIIIVFVAGVGLLRVMYVLSAFFPQATFLQAGIFNQTGNVSLIRPETTNLRLTIQKLIEQPWGYGVSLVISRNQQIIDLNYANAINVWAIGGGILCIFLMLCMLAYIALRYAIPCLRNNNRIIQALGLIFFSMTIHQISDGDWMRLDYLIIITIMILIQKHILQFETNTPEI